MNPKSLFNPFENAPDASTNALTGAAKELGEAARAMREASARIGALNEKFGSERAADSQRIIQNRGTSAAGAPTSLGGKAGAVGAAFVAAGAAMDRVAKAAEILNDSFQTGAQKTRALVAEFVPFGEKLIRLGDAIDGTADKMARQELDARVAKAQQSAQYAGDSKVRGARSEYATAAFGAESAQKHQYGTQDTFDRTTAGGRQGYADNALRQGAEDARVRAAREAETARRGVAYAEASMAKAEAEIKRRGRELETKQGRDRSITAYENRGFREKVGLGAARRESDLASDRLTASEKQFEEEIVRLRERRLTLAQSESALRKADLDVSKAELDIVTKRADRASATAERFGGMGKGERMFGAQALRMIAKNGIENLPPELLGAASGIAPGYVSELKQKSGEEGLKKLFSADELKQFFPNGAGGSDFDKSIKDQYKEADKLAADVRVSVQIDEEILAKQLAEALGPVIGQLIKATKAEVERVARDIRTGASIQANNKN